jgi:GntR family transcriptional repressor for pyruvate dehydrogenase complex
MGRNVSESIALMLAAETVSMPELLDARMSLEVPLAGRAAANADASVVGRLEVAIAEAEGHLPGTDVFNDADARFHQILAQAAGNDLLLALTAWILEVLQPTLVAHIAVNVDGPTVLEQHRAILRAVRRNQRSAAERAMAAHITYLGEVLARTDDP